MTKVREGNQGIAEQNMVLLPGAGMYVPKDLKEARHHSCRRQEWCLRQPLKHACKFSLSIFMGSFYSSVQTLGSVQIHVSLTRSIVQQQLLCTFCCGSFWGISLENYLENSLGTATSETSAVPRDMSARETFSG